MRIAVSSQGEGLDAQASPVFGRCPTFLFVDTETMAYEAMPNPAMSEGGGAGIYAAQFIVNQGAQAVITGNLGPNASDVLQAAGVPGYLVSEGLVSQAINAFSAGQLEPVGGANVATHAGMRGGSHGTATTQQSQPDLQREAELAELRGTLKSLRQQLAETMEQIDKLERD